MSIPVRPIANPLAILREEFDDYAVLFNPDTGDAIGLNPVGVAIWKQMDGSRSVPEIVASLSEQFSDTPVNLEEDVSAFMTDLNDRGLIGAEF